MLHGGLTSGNNWTQDHSRGCHEMTCDQLLLHVFLEDPCPGREGGVGGIGGPADPWQHIIFCEKLLLYQPGGWISLTRHSHVGQPPQMLRSSWSKSQSRHTMHLWTCTQLKHAQNCVNAAVCLHQLGHGVGRNMSVWHALWRLRGHQGASGEDKWALASLSLVATSCCCIPAWQAGRQALFFPQFMKISCQPFCWTPPPSRRMCA